MMVELALDFDRGPVQLGEIAKRQNLPVKYLEQLIIPLKRAGLIQSARGPKGGHFLARPPDRITVWDIVSVLEGEDGVAPCVADPESCDRSDVCPTRDVWNMVSRLIEEQLRSVTLADLAAKQQIQL